MKGAVFLAIAIVAAASAWAQEPHFQTQAHEVEVPVAVLTKASEPVEGLNANDFVVLSDGKPQTVRMISRDSGTLPVHAVLVVQANDASEAVVAKIKKTASVVSSYITNNIDSVTPSVAAVVTVSDDVRVEQDFTADYDLLRDAFRKLSAQGVSGRLLDGVSLACDMLVARQEPARRVIVLIGESRDRKSQAHFADVVVKAQRDDIAVYALSYSAYTTAFTQKASELPQPPDQARHVRSGR